VAAHSETAATSRFESDTHPQKITCVFNY
jgi:hypothetical protein